MMASAFHSFAHLRIPFLHTCRCNRMEADRKAKVRFLWNIVQVRGAIFCQIHWNNRSAVVFLS